MSSERGLRDIDAALAELVALAESGAEHAQVHARQFDLGLAWPTFPVGLGGRGLDAGAAREVGERVAASGIPQPATSFVGTNLVAPMVVQRGSKLQRELVRPIFTGEHRWCQLFSEPSAGSDLANVSTLAVRDGEPWTVRGQKVWNSFAREATHGISLLGVTRTCRSTEA